MSVDMLLIDEQVTLITFFYTHPQDHQLDPEWKMIRPDLGRIEKWVLRNAFDDEDKPYLPKVCFCAFQKTKIILPLLSLPEATSFVDVLFMRHRSPMTIPLNSNNINKPPNASPLLTTSLPSIDIARPRVLESMSKKEVRYAISYESDVDT
ncbi:hypothetical protein Bca4012_076675 [Brassica carinata]